MLRSFIELVSVVLSILLLSGCGERASPLELPSEKSWLRSELYFGIGLYGAEASVSDEAWFAFLDEVVTPEFPAGFSVASVYGQWKGQQMEAPVRLTSKKIIILHPDTVEDRNRIQRIRDGWNARYNHESVLLSQTPAAVSF